MKKVLIIKLGYCETLVDEDGFVPSLGDVFRHTVLLHEYKKDDVTWLTSSSAAPLLKNNPYINRLMIYNEGTRNALIKKEFDELICLEKAGIICKLASEIKTKKRMGFSRNKNGLRPHSGAESALDIASGKDPFLPFQAVLFRMVNSYWNGEEYLLGYKPKSQKKFDVGLVK
jgi:heptosyltransferase II